VNDGLVKSSNICMAKLGVQLGDQKLYEYVRRFGFGERTGIILPGEIGGVVHPPHTWSKLSITRITMGQEVAVTPLQMTTAMCAIANGGHLMMPQIIHEIVDDKGHSVSQYAPQEIRSVASKEATDAIRTPSSKWSARGARRPSLTLPGTKSRARRGPRRSMTRRPACRCTKSTFVSFSVSCRG